MGELQGVNKMAKELLDNVTLMCPNGCDPELHMWQF